MIEMHLVRAVPSKTDFIKQKWSFFQFLCVVCWQEKMRTLILNASEWRGGLSLFAI